MIDAKELRIGNYIKHIHSEDSYMIWSLGCFHLLAICESEDEFSPIPITPEWLERLGFESETILGLHVKYSLNRIEIWNDTALSTFGVDNIKNKIVWLKWVHQLQNLYFALAGEELTVKT